MKKILLLVLFSISSIAAVPNWQAFQGDDLITNKKSIKLNKNKEIGVFYFVSSVCPCSKSYFKYLSDLKEKFPEFSYMGFHVGKSISRKTARNYFSKFDIKFPILNDKKFEFADKFGALKTPHVFVVDKSGEILFHGGVANSRNMSMAKKFYLENALSEIKNGKKPSLAHAKALGCYIQR